MFLTSDLVCAHGQVEEKMPLNGGVTGNVAEISCGQTEELIREPLGATRQLWLAISTPHFTLGVKDVRSHRAINTVSRRPRTEDAVTSRLFGYPQQDRKGATGWAHDVNNKV